MASVKEEVDRINRGVDRVDRFIVAFLIAVVFAFVGLFAYRGWHEGNVEFSTIQREGHKWVVYRVRQARGDSHSIAHYPDCECMKKNLDGTELREK